MTLLFLILILPQASCISLFVVFSLLKDGRNAARELRHGKRISEIDVDGLPLGPSQEEVHGFVPPILAVAGGMCSVASFLGSHGQDALAIVGSVILVVAFAVWWLTKPRSSAQ